MNADCTATDTYTAGPVKGADRLVILDDGGQMQLMPTRHPLGPVAGRANFRRVARGEPQCTSDMVRGVYGGTAEGTYMVPVSGQPQPLPTPSSAISAMTLPPDGSGAIASTASLAGDLIDLQFTSVSVVVNSDCTATLKKKGISRQFPGRTLAGAVRYIVLNEGKELIGLETGSFAGLPVVIENQKRIAGGPVAPGR